MKPGQKRRNGGKDGITICDTCREARRGTSTWTCPECGRALCLACSSAQGFDGCESCDPSLGRDS